MISLVPSGPYQKRMQSFNQHAMFRIFKNRAFRTAAFGYFGHMWELYAFWAFIPLLLVTYSKMHPAVQLDISSLSFFIIALGGLACVAGGYLSQAWGAKKNGI
jgi:hypothetical protein